MSTTILASGLDILNHQTRMNNSYGKILQVAPHRFMDKMNLGFIPEYTKTSQLDCQTIRYNGTEETQDFQYPKKYLGLPPPPEYTNFNFAIDKHITRANIDVSGQIIPNNELRVLNNKGGSKFNSIKHVINSSRQQVPASTGMKYRINSSYRDRTLERRNDLIEVNDGFTYNGNVLPRKNGTIGY
jgi:hypothetical protein